jgi:hypothetical protein
VTRIRTTTSAFPVHFIFGIVTSQEPEVLSELRMLGRLSIAKYFGIMFDTQTQTMKFSYAKQHSNQSGPTSYNAGKRLSPKIQIS